MSQRKCLCFINIKKNNIISIDIENKYIKIVLLTRIKNNYKLIFAHKESINSEWFDNNTVQNATEIAKTISSILKNHKINRKKAGFIFPKSQLIHTNIDISSNFFEGRDLSSDRFIYQYLTENVSKYLDYNIDDISIDYDIEKNGEKTILKLFAIRKSQTQLYNLIAKKAGLVPSVLAIDSDLIINYLQFNKILNPDCIVLGLQINKLSIYIIKNLRLVFQDENILPKELPIEQYISLATSWLYKSIQFYNMNDAHIIDNLYLYGQKSYCDTLINQPEQDLSSYKIKYLNPFDRLIVDNPDFSIESPGDYVFSVSLAMREAPL